MKEMKPETRGERLKICTFIHMQACLDARVHTAYMVGGQKLAEQRAGHTDSQSLGSHVVKCIYTQSVQHSFMTLKLREPEPPIST